MSLNRTNNELEQFIYKKCHGDLFCTMQECLSQLPLSSINLEYCRIKWPDSASLKDLQTITVKHVGVDEDWLLFDAVVNCVIEVSEQDYFGAERHYAEVEQWYTISCSAQIENSLKSFEVTDIRKYRPGDESPDPEGVATSNCVPIIKKDDLDKEAEKFLKKFYPDALEKPMPVPIETIVREQMKLKIIQVYQISLDSSIFGEICFADGKIRVYDEHGGTLQLDVSPGTIIVDAKVAAERKNGCVNNTIAHEAFHWYKHRLCAAIKRIIRGEVVVAHRCPRDIKYPSADEEWTDKQCMEWQASQIAPRILMPRKQFIQKTEELLNKYDFYNCYDKKKTLENIIAELAAFYQVSKQSAGIRLGETGSSEVKSILEPPVVKMSEEALFYEYCVNADFRDLMDSGCFRYVDGYMALDDKKYVQPGRSGVYELTQYAEEHLDKCVIHFLPRNVNINRADDRYINLQFFGRSKEEYASLPYYDQSQNGPVLENLSQLEMDKAGFELEKSYTQAIKEQGSCWSAIYELMRLAGWDRIKMQRMTGLDDNTYYKAKNNNSSPPKLRTIVAFACGLGLTVKHTDELLQKAGHAFKDSQEDMLLRYCVSNFHNRPIEDCNVFLQSYGFDPLGSNQRI